MSTVSLDHLAATDAALSSIVPETLQTKLELGKVVDMAATSTLAAVAKVGII